jgi:hypothetical protein
MSDDTLNHDGHIPDNIAAFYLVNEITGEEAKKIMFEIHGEKIELDEAYALKYDTEKDAYGLVWISETSVEGLPQKLLENMSVNIANNDQYSNHSEKSINDKTVQYAYGFDRDYYYFVSKNRFVLVATYGDKSDIFIKNAVRIF